jgi:hypothetical protein
MQYKDERTKGSDERELPWRAISAVNDCAPDEKMPSQIK